MHKTFRRPTTVNSHQRVDLIRQNYREASQINSTSKWQSLLIDYSSFWTKFNPVTD